MAVGPPVVKVWNPIEVDSLVAKGRAAGDPDRITISVAAEREQDKVIALQLVEERQALGVTP